MSRRFKTEAIVLKKKSLPNQDYILTFLTEKYGMISVFGKGIKKITSRRSPHIQTGNLIEAIIYKKNNKFYLEETKLISFFSKIKTDPKKISKLYFLFFVLERLLPENQREEKIYPLAKKFLIDLSERKTSSEIVFNKYLNQIVRDLGYITEDRSLDELINLIQSIINEKITFFTI